VSVFIPTSPTPLTGFVVMVAREDVIPLSIPVDEAFRFCITAGMLSRDTGSNERPGTVRIPAEAVRLEPQGTDEVPASTTVPSPDPEEGE
jgi:uncharacterized membrane protein